MTTINELPQNLQAKLQPYMTVAGSVENAIETARLNGKWTEADDKKLTSLNGDANWGNNVDSFNPKKAASYKTNLAAKNAKEGNQQQKTNSGSKGAAAAGTALVGAVVGGLIAGPGGALVGASLGALCSCAGTEIEQGEPVDARIMEKEIEKKEASLIINNLLDKLEKESKVSENEEFCYKFANILSGMKIELEGSEKVYQGLLKDRTQQLKDAVQELITYMEKK